ncbi:hypothetical protein HYX13_00580 [Candidatus Woesearchaeota archaeon]|nr:hypothetical protein [Candidatus Woesearchaeota archaeon]
MQGKSKKYPLYQNVVCVENVVTAVDGSTQGLILASIPKSLVSKKQTLAMKINQEYHSLLKKHQSLFPSGTICYGASSSYLLQEHYREFQEKYQKNVIPLIREYYHLNPPNTRMWKKIISRPGRRYERGDIYEGESLMTF